MTACECKLAGWCERHRRNKSDRAFELCQTDQRYFDSWESRKDGTEASQHRPTEEQQRQRELIAETGRKAWEALFRDVETIQDLCRWEKLIPRYGCNCEKFYQTFLLNNPPGATVSLEWKWMLKSAVNKKLGKPNLSIEDARALWG
jgi:hypothetical protein